MIFRYKGNTRHPTAGVIPLKMRYTSIILVTVLAALVAVAGYFMPYGEESPGKRMLFTSKGGTVILTHASHEKQVNECGTCHHTSGDDLQPPSCSGCHAAKFDEAFASNHMDSFADDSQCSACHHALPSIVPFDHDKHVADYNDNDCRSCHHDASIEPEPQACSECHEHEAKDKVPSLREAAHARCSSCHDEPNAEGKATCHLCHEHRSDNAADMEPQKCSACHKGGTELLLPLRANAFHTQCQECHKTLNKGPFGPDACKQCHR